MKMTNIYKQEKNTNRVYLNFEIAVTCIYHIYVIFYTFWSEYMYVIGSLFWKFSFGKRCKHTMIKLLSEYFCWGEDWILNGEKSRLQRKLLRCFQKIKYCLTLFLLQKTLPPKMCMYFCSSKYRNIFSSI